MSSTVKHKPADAIEREIWAYLQANTRVTNKDIEANTGASHWKRVNYVNKLRHEKIVRVVDRVDNQLVFSAHDDVSVQQIAAQKRGTVEGAIWSAIRILKVFTADDLQSSLTTARPNMKVEQIKRYCSDLLKAEYLVVVEKARPPHRLARYRLVHNSGPLPPQRRRIAVLIDGNDDRLVQLEGVRT